MSCLQWCLINIEWSVRWVMDGIKSSHLVRVMTVWYNFTVSQAVGRNLKLLVVAIIQLSDCMWFLPYNAMQMFLKVDHYLIFHMRMWKFRYVKSSPKISELPIGQTWAELLASPTFGPMNYPTNCRTFFLIISQNNLGTGWNFRLHKMFFSQFLNISIYETFLLN